MTASNLRNEEHDSDRSELLGAELDDWGPAEDWSDWSLPDASADAPTSLARNPVTPAD